MKKQSSSLPFAVLTIRADAKIPLFRQIFNGLRNAILTGKLKPGTCLPSTRQLAEDLNVSRNTVLSAYDQLLAEGYLEGTAGSGTFVARNLPEERLQPGPIAPRVHGHHYQSRSPSKRGRKLAANLPDAGEVRLGDLLPYRNPIPFRYPTPELASFPFNIWSKLMAKYNRNPSYDLLDYSYPAGYPRLREVIAAYLKSARGVQCEAEQVIVVPSSQMGLDIIAQMLLDHGDTGLIEDPGYFGARAVFERAGIRITPIPIDEEGVSMSAIRKTRNDARIIYVTPSHQFPLGVTMSLARRLDLLEWARQTNAWIIEDDYDGEYRYTGRPIPSLQGLDGNERVIYIGTFSKMMFPSLRISYLVAPRDLAEVFIKGRILIDTQSSTIPQGALADFIEDGHFARHIRRMRKLYAERQACLIAAVKTELSGLLEVEERAAGMHLIGWLPPGVDDRQASSAAQRYNLTVLPLSAASLRSLGRGALVLGYTGFNEQQISMGVRQLRIALSDFSRNP
jgi:GntR family transcriptional regulator / MocR family aminotransferase